MSFEYCCFISYPHGQENVLVPCVEDFVIGLEKEIYSLTRRKLWIDYKFLKGGSRHDHEIGPGLCKSACMILIYTPLYLDAEHMYCARELKAMQDLEQERLKLLTDKSKGLIIPIILRGEKRFPDVLRRERLYYNFTDIEFNNPMDVIRVKYAKQIKEVAEYIVHRCEVLDQVFPGVSHNCDGYTLPSGEAAKRYVESVLGTPVREVAVLGAFSCSFLFLLDPLLKCELFSGLACIRETPLDELSNPPWIVPLADPSFSVTAPIAEPLDVLACLGGQCVPGGFTACADLDFIGL
jgi:hypothetical protein